MKTLEIKVKRDNEVVVLHLRLTAGAQKKLKEKYDEDTMTTLLGSVNEIDQCVDVLDAALNYKGNDNSITDGEELYDLLVDNGTCGSEGFTKVITDIAVNSGIISGEQASSLNNTVKSTYDSIFANLGSIVNEVEKAVPTRKKSANKADNN